MTCASGQANAVLLAAAVVVWPLRASAGSEMDEPSIVYTLGLGALRRAGVTASRAKRCDMFFSKPSRGSATFSRPRGAGLMGPPPPHYDTS